MSQPRPQVWSKDVTQPNLSSQSSLVKSKPEDGKTGVNEYFSVSFIHCFWGCCCIVLRRNNQQQIICSLSLYICCLHLPLCLFVYKLCFKLCTWNLFLLPYNEQVPPRLVPATSTATSSKQQFIHQVQCYTNWLHLNCLSCLVYS